MAGQGLAIIGLGQEPSRARETVTGDGPAGGDEESDPRPAPVDQMREFQAIVGTRHLDIGEHQTDVLMNFQLMHCFRRVAGLDDLEAKLSQKIGAVEPHEDLVLDDERTRCQVCGFRFHE